MYSCKENINILTSLLVKHGVRHAVVCPGSRNAPIVHNLNECDDITCHPVTDERSAGFYAIGVALAAGGPVAVCVTSGSALLNLAPAVAEAFYRHVPLVVVSADRPMAWIGQLDGQTLPQPDAFGGFVAKCVALPEPQSGDERWHCNRLVNEALLAADSNGGCPVHINVPITEPLFVFNVGSLPDERVIRRLGVSGFAPEACEGIVNRVCASSRPMVVVGQHRYSEKLAKALRAVSERVTVLQEPLSPGLGAVHFDEVLSCVMDNAGYMPDFILYAGDTIVSKRLRKLFRRLSDVETWAVSEDGEVHDTFMNQTIVIESSPEDVFCGIASLLEGSAKYLENSAKAFFARWKTALDCVSEHAVEHVPCYSQMLAVKRFESLVGDNCIVHYANSSAVRLANIYADRYVYVNRGVNGIEGTLSTAAGFAAVCDTPVYCVIGDLSFFYDCNALWNNDLQGNFRILLLNNNCGGIFHRLPGLDSSPVYDTYVAGAHAANARGICDAHGVGYLSVRSAEELEPQMKVFVSMASDRPLLLEVFTDVTEDAQALEEYYCALHGLFGRSIG